MFVPLAAAQAMLRSATAYHHVSIEQPGDASRSRRTNHVASARSSCRGRQAATRPVLAQSVAWRGGSVVDDFTVKTQAAANVTKGLYTSVPALRGEHAEARRDYPPGNVGHARRAGSTMTALLASIAAISLIVGGMAS